MFLSTLVDSDDAPQSQPCVIDAAEIVEVVAGAVTLGNVNIKCLRNRNAKCLGSDIRGIGVGNFLFLGHAGQIKGMLFLVCSVQKPDDDFVTGIGFQNRSCRIPVYKGTENICRVTVGF